MLIYCCCRLRATVTIRVVEIDGRDAMFVTSAFESRAAVHRFGCLYFTSSTLAHIPIPVSGSGCTPLEQEMNAKGSLVGEFPLGNGDQ
jgi:hypothetical protein